MPKGGQNSERVLILAPHGRDADLAATLLAEAGRHTCICADIGQLHRELHRGAAFALVTEEALLESDLSAVAGWVAAQPSWSDLPIVLLTMHGDTPARVDDAARYQEILGNVTYLERPFHPTTLISVARSAIRSRRRQYEARESFERYVLLARELQHRTKNLLAVIQSIASASLPGSPGRDRYFARLHALARAQDLVMEGGERGASIRHVVQQALQSFGARISLEGPDVYLTPTTVQGFALILHELATNAAKHGALKAPTGKISVCWSEEQGPPLLLHFHWRERGGPPALPPTHKGFGTMLLELAVPSGDKPPLFQYSADGFDYELQAILEQRSLARPAAALSG